ncbi:MAG: prenyltransferase/squalene oxidase repeat-containing protein [Pirellulaceae bacterium]
MFVPPARRIDLMIAFRLMFLLMLVVGCVIPVTADETAFERDEIDRAVDKAVGFLISKQRDDGAITDRSHDVTMTSLSIMAFASVGHLPGDPTPAGEAASKALSFVLKDGQQDDEGYFGRHDGSRMYGHGITTLMLTEMLGMGVDQEQDQKIHDQCQKAIDLILVSQQQRKDQNNKGGWRYTPTSNDADLSVSVWQLMALRSAKNDGLQVPSSAIDEAIEYLKRSYTASLDRNGLPDNDKPAGFSYTPGQRHPTYTMTAAGLLAMQVCGQYESPLVAGAAEWLMEHPPKANERFFHYGTYYYAQGMYQRGGKYAKEAEGQVAQVLLPKQRDDGSWLAEQGEEQRIGHVYSTAMSMLTLSVKYHYLPIYQK